MAKKLTKLGPCLNCGHSVQQHSSGGVCTHCLKCKSYLSAVTALRRLRTGKLPKETDPKRRERCQNCNHARRDHDEKRGCVVCFGCRKFGEKRRKPVRSSASEMCRCLHTESKHAGKKRCGAEKCHCVEFRPLNPDPPIRSTSVRTVPGGGFESSRRRH